MEEEILKVGFDYCDYISLLIKNGFHLEEAKKEAGLKIASYKDTISERLKNKDYTRDGLYASCEKVWGIVGSLRGKAKAQALLSYFGVDADPSEWLYRSKSCEEIVKTIFVFIDEDDDIKREEPVEFKVVPGLTLTTSTILEKCKKAFDGYWYRGGMSPYIRDIFRCKKIQYTCDWCVVTKYQYL